MKKTYTILIAIISFSFISCMSQNVEIPQEATALEIIQQAQNAFDNGKKKTAIKCYETLLQRYGNNPAIYVEGRYEIAHILIKQKKYDQAKVILLELKEIYDSSAPGMLPGAYRKMAMKDLEKVQEKTKAQKEK